MAPADSPIPLPPQEKTSLGALFLAVLVHVLLVGALFLGVQWKSQAPAAVQVEVWRSVPAPVTAPPQPEPPTKPQPEPPPPPPEAKVEPKVEPPPPVKPDIVVKEEKKDKPKPEIKPPPEPKPEPKPDPKPRPEPKPKPPEPKPAPPNFANELQREQKQMEQKRVQDQQRERAAAEANVLAQLKAEQAAADSRGLDDYTAKIRGKIKGNMNIAGLNIQGNPQAVFKVVQLPSGEVLDVQLRKSSGNTLLDQAIERAIRKSSPLPLPDRPDLFRRELELKYKPFDD